MHVAKMVIPSYDGILKSEIFKIIFERQVYFFKLVLLAFFFPKLELKKFELKAFVTKHICAIIIATQIFVFNLILFHCKLL